MKYLLSEYYETLRWYTSMQHYRSMKERIGGTKSFASRYYNQQFYGTLKKIRHLFSITPILGDNTVLKFDQALYNEYPNNKNNSILNDSLIHEELLADENYSTSVKDSVKLPKDLINESVDVVGEYLNEAKPIRQQIIQQYLKDENYWDLTRFLFKGQKTRGEISTTNPQNFLNQEKDYLYTKEEKDQLDNFENQKIEQLYQNNTFKQSLWISLIKKCQTQLYDRKAIKEYLSYRVEKRERRKQIQQKQLKERLDKIQNWYLNKKNLQLMQNWTDSSNQVSTGIQKAIKEGIENQKDIFQSKRKLGHKHSLNSTQLKNITNTLKLRIKDKNLERISTENRLKNSLNSVKILVYL